MVIWIGSIYNQEYKRFPVKPFKISDLKIITSCNLKMGYKIGQNQLQLIVPWKINLRCKPTTDDTLYIDIR